MQEFKVYPEYASLYFKVFVYDTPKELKQHIQRFKEWYSSDNTDNIGAVTIPMTVYNQKTGKRIPYIGDIVFCRGTRFDEIVAAHESVHASVIYSINKGISHHNIFFFQDPDNKKTDDTAHERFARINTNIYEQIIKKTLNKNIPIKSVHKLEY